MYAIRSYYGADADHQPGVAEGADLVDRDPAARERRLLVAEVAVEGGREVGEGQDLEAEGGDELLDLFHLERLQADVRQQHHLVVVEGFACLDQLLDQRPAGEGPAAFEPPLVVGGVDPDQREFDLAGDAADSYNFV